MSPPDTVCTFPLDSSGAVILFVYLLLALPQFVLRRQRPDEDLKIKMWFFAGLTILAAVGIVALLAQMGFKSDTRSQLLLSLLSWWCRPARSTRVRRTRDLQPARGAVDLAAARCGGGCA